MNEQLQEVLASVFGIAKNKVTPDLTKEDVDSWDSLKQMDLVASLEENFAIELDIQDIISMNSVQQIIDVLNRKKAL